MKKLLPIISASLLILLLFLGGEAAARALEFNRNESGVGAVLRLFSCNLVHFDASHLLWDVGALTVLCLALAHYAPSMLKISLAMALPTIALAVYSSDYTIYRGVSGIDSALFGTLTAVLLARSWKRRDKLAFGAVLVGALGFVGKLVIEVVTRVPVFAAQAGYEPASGVHLAAFIAGASAAPIAVAVEYLRGIWYANTLNTKEIG